MIPESFKCPACRNAVIESAREGDGRLITRYKQIRRVNGNVQVQCRQCGRWIQIDNGLI